MQEESTFPIWCNKVVTILDSVDYTDELLDHIDECAVCSAYLTDEYDAARVAQFAILNWDEEKSKEVLQIIDSEEEGSQIVV